MPNAILGPSNLPVRVAQPDKRLQMCLLCYELCQTQSIMVHTRDRPISFFETDTDIFKKIFTNIWPAVDFRLATYTDTAISKFAYQYFCRFLTRYFG